MVVTYVTMLSGNEATNNTLGASAGSPSRSMHPMVEPSRWPYPDVVFASHDFSVRNLEATMTQVAKRGDCARLPGT